MLNQKEAKAPDADIALKLFIVLQDSNIAANAKKTIVISVLTN